MADGSGSPYQLRITFDRFLKVVPQDHILVVTPARFAGEARKVLPELLPENLLQEPMARKTAPCMAYAAYTLLSRNPEAVIVATPWDLVIRDESLFAHTLGEAFNYVEENDVLMTLGIVPKTPDVNFGYIQVREGRNAHLMAGPLQVKTFTEKPSPELADVFVRTGEFFWNSGIFVWKAATIVSEMAGGHGNVQGLGNPHRRPCFCGAGLRRMPQGFPGLRRHGAHLPRVALSREIWLGGYR